MVLGVRRNRRERFRAWCQDATTLRRVHGYATLAWLALAVPAVLWWRHSVPFLVFVSVYANVTGHWSSWQASRVEVKQEEAMEDVADATDPRLVIVPPAGSAPPSD
jgi:hypothetical protein